MPRFPRFHKTGKGSFFGDFVYNRVVKRDHFLVALQELFDWDALCGDLIKLYKGKGLRGRPPYKPELTFKMLFLSYLYNVSERQMEQLANYHLVVKWFLGLAVDEPAPDHSTLTKFKERLICFGRGDELQRIFDGLIRQAMEQGIEMGDIQLLDSVHTRADVNYEKERDRQDQGKPPRDPDAQVVHKGRRSVVGPDGRRTVRNIRLRGYKLIVLRTRLTARSMPRPAWPPASSRPVGIRRTTRPLSPCANTIALLRSPPPPMEGIAPTTTPIYTNASSKRDCTAASV